MEIAEESRRKQGDRREREREAAVARRHRKQVGGSRICDGAIGATLYPQANSVFVFPFFTQLTLLFVFFLSII